MVRRSCVCGGFLAVVLLGACSSSDNGGTNVPDGGGGGSGGDAAVDAAGDAVSSDTAAVTQSFVILHTNDLHSYLMGSGPEADYTPATTNDDGTVGGLARLAKDAAVELMALSKLGYDATTIGNHELDWSPAGLALILKTATDKGFAVPILASNMNFSPTDPGDDDLEKFKTAGIIKTKLVKTVGALKVGIFGLLGANAALVAGVKAPLTFSDLATASAAMVTELRQTDKVDVVIALSHSGIDATGKGEDRMLADNNTVNAAGGIDVIVSGHTHDAVPTPIHTGKTWIVQAGSYSQRLGSLRLTATKTDSGTTVGMDGYTLTLLDDKIAGDPTTQATVDGYIAAIDTFLGPAGLMYKKVIGETTADIVAAPYAESGLGDLVTDAYLNVTKALQPTAPPVIAIDASGDIRADIKAGKAGKQWVADLFRVQPLGLGPTDQKPGFPLVTLYVNAPDIIAGLELSAAAKDLGSPDFLLQVSGLTVTWKASGDIFKRVSSVKVGDTEIVPTDTATCYKLVTNIYVAGLLGLIEKLMAGQRSVVPKQEDCKTPIADLRTRIVDANPLTPEIEELKEWQALMTFVSKLPDTNGNMIPDIPATYAVPAMPPRIVIMP